MTITLDDVSYLLHFPIRGKLLGHGRIGREEGVNMMVTHLGFDPIVASQEERYIRGAHTRFSFFGKDL